MGVHERLMKKILAIGGAVIKTAKDELKEAIERDMVEMLIHNGGSIFHDFQQEIDPDLESHSYPLEKLVFDSYECNTRASDILWIWLWHSIKLPDQDISHTIPEGSITRLCYDKNIPVLLFTTPGADFWHLFSGEYVSWSLLSDKAWLSMHRLVARFKEENFHFMNVGSATMHPEIFIKAVAVAKPNQENFQADVVDFKDMYRPRTRVARFGTYYTMSHKEFFKALLKGDIA